MRKQVFGRRFKRDKNERKALFSGLISAMVLHGSIKTTEQKAKAIKGDLEKLVTKAKKGETSRRILQSSLTKSEIDKMINEIAPGFRNRAGGYTRIIKTGNRFSDNASMAILEWSEKIIKIEKPAITETQKKTETQKLSGSKKLRASAVARKTSKRTSSTGRKQAKKGAK